MRQSLITFFICLSVSLGVLAQPEGVKIKEKQRIPIDPIIVEGEVTDVPDGTLVEFNYRIGKAKRYSQANWVLGDTGRRNEMVPDYPPPYTSSLSSLIVLLLSYQMRLRLQHMSLRRSKLS